MKAVLHACLRDSAIESVAVPGLCGLTGRMHPEMVARQMRIAYERVVLGKYAYSHWREERGFAEYVLGRLPLPPDDLAAFHGNHPWLTR